MPTSDLRWQSAPTHPDGVVLVLHGGQVTSHQATRWRHMAVLRMLPVASSIASRGHGHLAVVRLRYAVRGWNGVAASPVVDTRAALDVIAGRYPRVPVGLVGHSMGGRVALALASDERVEAVVGLAPWVDGHELPRVRAAQRVLVIHGLADRITSPRASRRVVEQLQAQGHVASFVGLARELHAMVLRYPVWIDLTSGFLAAVLTPGRPPPRLPPQLDSVVSQAAGEGVVTEL